MATRMREKRNKTALIPQQKECNNKGKKQAVKTMA